MKLLPSHRTTQRRAAMAIVLAALMASGTISSAIAQDTTVIGGGGSESGVTVNLDALDGGGATSRRSRSRPQLRQPDGRGAASGQQRIELRQPGSTTGQSPDAKVTSGADVEGGDLVRGPTGALLRFPPNRPPRSQLLVDPNSIQRRAQRQSETGQSETGQSGNPAARESRQGATTQTASQPRQQSRQNSAQAAPLPSAVPEAPNLPEAPDARDNAAQTPESVTPEAKPQSKAPEGTAQGGDTSEGASKTSQASGTSQTGQTAGQTPRPEQKPERADAVANAQTGTDTDSAKTATVAGSDTGSASESADTTGTGKTAKTGEGETSADETAETAAQSDSPANGTQEARRTPADAPPADRVRLAFEPGASSLSERAAQKLEKIADLMNRNPDARLQIKAFADSGGEGPSQARRLSLSRALTVRSALIDKGIRSTRIDVRALGDTAGSGPLNRVDIVRAQR